MWIKMNIMFIVDFIYEQDMETLGQDMLLSCQNIYMKVRTKDRLVIYDEILCIVMIFIIVIFIPLIVELNIYIY